jgi:predicted Zn-dependent protease
MDTYAYMQADEGKFESAIALQKKAVSAEPKNYVIRLNLARIYLKAGQKDLATVELEALAQIPDQPGLQAEVARLRKATKDG